MLETSQYTAFKIINKLFFLPQGTYITFVNGGFIPRRWCYTALVLARSILETGNLCQDTNDAKASLASFFSCEALLHTRNPELSLMSGWIKLEAVQITACMLAQQTGRCRCYLLHPGDPDTTRQSEEREDLWVSGANKQDYEKDMNILAVEGGGGGGGRGWRHQPIGSRDIAYHYVHYSALKLSWMCLRAFTYQHASVAKLLVLYVINITPAPHYVHVNYIYMLKMWV